MLDAIVLAGSTNRGLLQECSNAQKEALIEISGRCMVDYVLDALDNSPEINRVIVVGLDSQETNYQGSKVIIWTPGGATILESLENGLMAVTPGKKALLLTADIPLLHPQAITAFLAQCGNRQADLYYPIISKELSETRFPGVKRTYASLREGTYTGGNIFLLEPCAVERCRAMLYTATNLRKSPWRLSRLLGLCFLIKFISRQLSLRDIESKLQEFLGIKAKIIISTYPEIGVDVDKPSDLRLVEQELAKLSS